MFNIVKRHVGADMLAFYRYFRVVNSSPSLAFISLRGLKGYKQWRGGED